MFHRFLLRFFLPGRSLFGEVSGCVLSRICSACSVVASACRIGARKSASPSFATVRFDCAFRLCFIRSFFSGGNFVSSWLAKFVVSLYSIREGLDFYCVVAAPRSETL